MSNHSDNLTSKGPTVLLFSRHLRVAESLLEKLLKNYCRVILVTEDKRGWLSSGLIKKKREALELVDYSRVSGFKGDYLVSISTCGEKGRQGKKDRLKVEGQVRSALRVSKINFAKSLFVFPYAQSSLCQKRFSLLAKTILEDHGRNSAVVYLGEVVSFYDDKEAGLVTETIREAATKRSLKVPKKDIEVYPLEAEEISAQLIKMLFSFGPYGSKMALISKDIRLKKIIDILKKIKPELKVEYEKDFLSYSLPAIKQTVEVRTDIDRVVREVYGEFRRRNKAARKPELRARKGAYLKKKPTGVLSKKLAYKAYKRKILAAAISIAIAFVMPGILLGISASSLLFAKGQLERGNYSFSNTAVAISGTTAKFAFYQLIVYSKTPLIGKVFDKMTAASGFFVDVSKLGKRGVSLAKNSSEFAEKIMGDEVYDVSTFSESIERDLDHLYEELGFLQGEIASSPLLTKWLGVFNANKENIAAARNKIYFARQLVSELPQILGKDEPRTYLVIFQNNMELRPTGGFIGSFALASFSEGRLVDISVFDVYSADGQLKGHVEPPGPIKDYLGEAGWFLRDSNWDPDFPKSAARAEWFLDKEIDKEVDGVIGIDLEFARNVLKETGAITISDFGKEVTFENLYEITQEEVEKDFFPGSRKKAGFLTALSRELMIRLESLPSQKQLGVAKNTFKSLEEKHIQIFLHNTEAQKAISSLKWDGAVFQPLCYGNCYADWVGMVEANLGVNKLNYYTKRSAELVVKLEKGLVKRDLLVRIENSAEPRQDAPGRYKAYLRVLTPVDSKFGPVQVLAEVGKELVEPEVDEVRGHLEVGVLIEVAPGEHKSILFTWEGSSGLSFNEGGEYQLYWRKQAGTNKDPIAIKVGFAESKVYTTSPPFSLTEVNSFSYNTTLSRDFVSRIYW